jgi:hypothetical protein
VPLAVNVCSSVVNAVFFAIWTVYPVALLTDPHVARNEVIPVVDALTVGADNAWVVAVTVGDQLPLPVELTARIRR